MRKYLQLYAEIDLPIWTFEYLIVIISDLVINQLQKSQAIEETATDIEFEKTLSEVMPKVKDIAFNAKKTSQTSATADE